MDAEGGPGLLCGGQPLPHVVTVFYAVSTPVEHTLVVEDGGLGKRSYMRCGWRGLGPSIDSREGCWCYCMRIGRI